jgi:hypothetical protein
MCTTELRSTERGAHETGSTEIGFTEIGFPEIRFPEIRLPEVGSTEIGLFEIGPTEFCSKEVYLKTEVLSPPLVPNVDSLLQNLDLFVICHRVILSTRVSLRTLLCPAYLSP